MLIETFDRRTFLRRAAAGLTAARLDTLRSCQDARQDARQVERLATAGKLSALGSATAWINSPPLTGDGLAGKVVLIQFCTFTCINWLRTLPNIREWTHAYGKAGLVVIGVHTPEFDFERNTTNVKRAVQDLKVEYPVAVDSDSAIWRAFENQYWPALYLLDGKGQVRHHYFGEGGYAESEQMIQQLLTEAGARELRPRRAPLEGRGIEASADWADARSPENYLGYERTEHFASQPGAAAGGRRTYTSPSELRLNQWALDGDWTVGKRSIALDRPNGRIAYRFHSRDLHLVMGPPSGVPAVRFRVLLDGQPPNEAHGLDVDEEGTGVAIEQRLHQLIRQPKPIVDRTFAIEFLGRGVDAFAFTFG
jgi:thiol-disulfide isomerase/thioredoxin